MPKNIQPFTTARSFTNPQGLRFIEGDGGNAGGADGSAAGSTGSDSGSGGDGANAANSKGFPEGTPVADMKPEEQAAYWKFQSRKHEERSRAFGGLTTEELASLRDKATRHDALERELMSDKDKAVAEARDAAKAEALASVTPRLVAAEFKAAAAGRVEPARLATILEPLDLSKFLNGDEVDTDKVAAFVDGIAPAAAPQPKGPTSTGQGRRESSTGPSVASGRDLYRAQRGKK